MDANAIRQRILEYAFAYRTVNRGDTTVTLAWFAELPFCIAEGSDEVEARAELYDHIAPIALEEIEKAGGAIPTPLRAGAQTRGPSVRFTSVVSFDMQRQSGKAKTAAAPAAQTSTHLSGMVGLEARDIATASAELCAT